VSGGPSSKNESLDGRQGARVLDAFIDAVDWKRVMEIIGKWADARQSRYVCFCNVHSVVMAGLRRDTGYAVRSSDLALPDGMPVVWMLRRLGFKSQLRINGPDFMWRFCSYLQNQPNSVYLYGNQQSTLDVLSTRLMAAFPGLRIAGDISPPYRQLTPDEDDAVVNAINASGASVVFISLGCPKQEVWMAKHRDRIQAVLIGVGAAFDYHAGTLRRADPWMQAWGLEWAYRLACEPRRLWKRYLLSNSVFMLHAAAQLFARAVWGRRASMSPDLSEGDQ
jgi:N-acetylglucosaminyldiphosphoundecaprenol N-acetyl-beta-D-mannosaminyltransferase